MYYWKYIYIHVFGYVIEIGYYEICEIMKYVIPTRAKDIVYIKIKMLKVN